MKQGLQDCSPIPLSQKPPWQHLSSNPSRDFHWPAGSTVTGTWCKCTLNIDSQRLQDPPKRLVVGNPWQRVADIANSSLRCLSRHSPDFVLKFRALNPTARLFEANMLLPTSFVYHVYQAYEHTSLLQDCALGTKICFRCWYWATLVDIVHLCRTSAMSPKNYLLTSNSQLNELTQVTLA